MKVALISRATLFSSPGGDTRQVEMTAAYLRQAGVEADVLLTSQPVDYSRYDLLHFFNIIRPADILGHIAKANKPFVVSTIFLDYGDFEKEARTGLKKWMNRIFSRDQIEYIKAVGRWVVNGERIGSVSYLLRGHAASVRLVTRKAAMLLPNSENEYRRFLDRYRTPQQYRVVPNGIDPKLLDKEYKINEKYRDAVICVARIEGRKNQLNLVRALNNTEFSVYIQGKPSPNNMGYYEQCQREAAPNVRFSNWIPDEELMEMYHSARVHILPSYFETTGLSSLEAAVLGCNIVVTEKGDTRDYFRDDAWYCEPDDPASIREAVRQAHAAPYSEAFRDFILTHYTWERAAAETLAGYKTVLHTA